MNLRSFAVVLSALTALGLVACKSSGTTGAGGSGGSGGGAGGETSQGGGGGGTGGGGDCNPDYSCAEAIDPTDGDPAALCDDDPSAGLFDALFDCACAGACATQCGDNVCASMDMSADCQACLADTAAGCGNDLNACSNDF